MADFHHRPLVRHAALAPFSRDHYSGLVQSQHLIKAGRADDIARRKAVAEFVDVYDHDILPHFRDEERLLGPVLSDADRSELLRQHRRLEQDAESLRRLRRAVDPDPRALVEAGRRLEAHIRWEERELFARVQAQLDAQQIRALQRRTEAVEAVRPRHAGKPPRSGGA